MLLAFFNRWSEKQGKIPEADVIGTPIEWSWLVHQYIQAVEAFATTENSVSSSCSVFTKHFVCCTFWGELAVLSYVVLEISLSIKLYIPGTSERNVGGFVSLDFFSLDKRRNLSMTVSTKSWSISLKYCLVHLKQDRWQIFRSSMNWSIVHRRGNTLLSFNSSSLWQISPSSVLLAFRLIA